MVGVAALCVVGSADADGDKRDDVLCEEEEQRFYQEDVCCFIDFGGLRKSFKRYPISKFSTVEYYLVPKRFFFEPVICFQSLVLLTSVYYYCCNINLHNLLRLS